MSNDELILGALQEYEECHYLQMSAKTQKQMDELISVYKQKVYKG